MQGRTARKIEIIATGDELLYGRILDTNSHWIARRIVELGGVGIVKKLSGKGIGMFLIRSSLKRAEAENYQIVVSLTNNPKLQEIYLGLGFKKQSPDELRFRQEQSSNTQMFVFSFKNYLENQESYYKIS